MAKCGAYLRVMEMAMAASSISRFGSGQSVKRVEDEALLRGQGRFADNVPEPGQQIGRASCRERV